jgi:D-beta-D-heptose 7-phosphate kinase/D-beta-D-heptose 1-phosphate adenosyltransferase
MFKVLVVGESCIDRFVYCNIERLSPEAPVPVLIPVETTENKGMSGNVVENLRALGVDYNQITHWYQFAPITKTRYVDKKTNHMFIRVDEGEDLVKDINDINMNQFFNIIIVSDYNKGFLDDSILKEICTMGGITILDSKRKLTQDIIDCFDFVKLNEQESINNKELTGLDNVLITLGSRGTMYQGVIYPSPNPQETIDVSGAGDTFTSSFILKYYETKDVKTSIIYANEKSSIVVSKRGVATP